MDLEFHQLDLRYEELRGRCPARERRLLSSLAEVGQQAPIVVVIASDAVARHVVIDGYKRVRLLRRLGQDTVRATAWDLSEAEALLFERTMREGDADNALEQGWLLRELRDRFALSGEELARRFGRTPSWVSRRLGLVAELPASVQRHVRSGAIGAHAAMKYLVPLARANRADGERLADAVAPLALSARQMAVVHTAWLGASADKRELMLKDPALVLRAHEEVRRVREEPRTATHRLLADLGALGGLAGRVHQRMRRGEVGVLLPPEREEFEQAIARARREMERLLAYWKEEESDARSEHPRRDPATA
jgi:ParB/RepB/Spo0J family partition protein